MLKTPDEWCRELNAKVLDPDGWRNAGRKWEDPVSREQFDALLAGSTIDSSGYPSFAGEITFVSGVE